MTFASIPSGIHLTAAAATETAPHEIDSWLSGKGWQVVGSHPDTNEPLYRKGAGYGSDATMYYRWHEAVAYEMYVFLSLGGE